MARYRNIGSLPLNYGEGCPYVKPGEEFNAALYPRMPHDQVAQHLQLGLIEEIPAPGSVVDELHVHSTRDVVDALDAAAGARKSEE